MQTRDMDTLINRYGRLEAQVRQQMEGRCRDSCANCRRVCCRVHFCIETKESAFLDRVARRFSPHARFHRQRGWLASNGCTLVAGRPPVCYEFLCRDIPDAHSGDVERRHALLALSMLITYVGRRAIGGRHLVEATRDGDLGRIRPRRLLARLDEAEAALADAAAILDGRSVAVGTRMLSRIVPPPTDGFAKGD